MCLNRIFLLLFSLVGISSFAQTTFTIEYPDVISVGDNFKVSFLLTGSNEYESFDAPTFSGAEVLFGPTYSPRQSAVKHQGKSTTLPSLVITYTMRALQEGKCSIGAASISVKGRTYSTQPRKVSIVKSESLTRSSEENSSQKGIAPNDLFMRASISKKTVYEQEPVLVSLYLYSRIANLSGLDRTPPEMSDFISQEIPLGSTKQWSTESVNGRLYYKALIWQILALPQRQGKLSIPAFGYDFIASIPRKKDAGKVFRGSDMQQIRVPLKSNPMEIVVKPLPKPQPSSFDGAVGQMDIKARIEAPKGYKTHDSFHYRLTIKGKGNGSLISIPAPELPDAFEVYAPEESLQEKATTSGIVFTKEIDYTIVPRSVGDYTIPPFEFSFFDPQQNKYIEQKTPAFAIHTEEGTQKKSSVEDSIPQNRWIETLKDHSTSRPIVWYSYLLIQLFLLLSSVIIVLWIGIQRKKKSNIVEYNHKKAENFAQQRMQKAKKYLQSGNRDLFYRELLSVLYAYCSEKYNYPIGLLNRENISALFEEHSIEGKYREEFFSLLNTIEQAHYSPESDRLSGTELVERISQLIVQLSTSNDPNRTDSHA